MEYIDNIEEQVNKNEKIYFKKIEYYPNQKSFNNSINNKNINKYESNSMKNRDSKKLQNNNEYNNGRIQILKKPENIKTDSYRKPLFLKREKTISKFESEGNLFKKIPQNKKEIEFTLNLKSSSKKLKRISPNISERNLIACNNLNRNKKYLTTNESNIFKSSKNLINSIENENNKNITNRINPLIKKEKIKLNNNSSKKHKEISNDSKKKHIVEKLSIYTNFINNKFLNKSPKYKDLGRKIKCNKESSNSENIKQQNALKHPTLKNSQTLGNLTNISIISKEENKNEIEISLYERNNITNKNKILTHMKKLANNKCYTSGSELTKTKKNITNSIANEENKNIDFFLINRSEIKHKTIEKNKPLIRSMNYIRNSSLLPNKASYRNLETYCCRSFRGNILVF